MDWLYLVLTLVFFASALGLLRLCDRLMAGER